MKDELELESDDLLYCKCVVVFSDLSFFQEWQGDIFQIVRSTYSASEDDNEVIQREWDTFVKGSQFISQNNVRKIQTTPTLGVYTSESNYKELEDESILFFSKKIFKSFEGERIEKKGFFKKYFYNGYISFLLSATLTFILINLPYTSSIMDWVFKPIDIIVSLSLFASLIGLPSLLLLILILKAKPSVGMYNIIDLFNLNVKMSLKGVPAESEGYLIETVSYGFWGVVLKSYDRNTLLDSIRGLLGKLKARESELLSDDSELNTVYGNISLKGIYVCDPETRNRITGNLLPLNKREYFGFVTLKGLTMYTAIMLSIHLIILLLLG